MEGKRESVGVENLKLNTVVLIWAEHDSLNWLYHLSLYVFPTFSLPFLLFNTGDRLQGRQGLTTSWLFRFI